MFLYWVVEPETSDALTSFIKEARDSFISSISSFPTSVDERVGSIRSYVEWIGKTSNVKISELELERAFYYLYREIEGYGKIHALLLDDQVEDISCVGSNAPLYLIHKHYGAMESNVIFENDTELDRFVRLMVQRSGKHVSLAVPMVDCSLPNGARIQATLGKEVTKNGSTFSIRRFREKPFTPLDLMNNGTLSSEIAAYLWMAVEQSENIFFVGGTASGKTTTLNSILLFVPPDKKIVSIEDTRELNIPHENWVQAVTRPGTGEVNPATNKREGEVDMFELLVNSLRQRPDYLVVGEIRGREAYTAFQAMAAGQTTLSTFHSTDIPSFVHRLEGEPLKIPRAMIASLNIVVLQGIVKVRNELSRRVKKVVEIVGVEGESKEVVTNMVYEWNQTDDRFVYSGHSYLFDKLMRTEAKTLDQVILEFQSKVSLLEAMANGKGENFLTFTREINNFTASSYGKKEGGE